VDPDLAERFLELVTTRQGDQYRVERALSGIPKRPPQEESPRLRVSADFAPQRLGQGGIHTAAVSSPNAWAASR